MITTDLDTLTLQHDIDVRSAWCQSNKLDLNIKKCAIISFSRTLNQASTTYLLNGTRIQAVDDIKDLGVFIDKKFTFIKWTR